MLKQKSLCTIIAAAFASFWLGSVPAFAQQVRYQPAPQPALVFTKEEGEAYAVFRRLDDVWLVSSSVKTPMALTPANAPRILEQEKLYIRGGQGLRLRFEKLDSINVVQSGQQLQVKLNQPSNITPLDVDITQRNGRTLINRPLGTGDMHRATSFRTGESYLVLPTFLNRGTPQVREKGDVRQLKTAVGSVFVSSEGLPMGFDNQQDEIVFSPMKDALSRAAAQYRKRLSPDFIDALLAQLTQAKQDIQARQPRFEPAPVRTGIDLPPVTGENRASFDAAMNRMEAALSRIDAIGGIAPRQQRPMAGMKMAAVDTPEVETAALVSDLENQIREEELGLKKKTASSATEQKVLAGDVLFPDFGRRSEAEYARINERLKDDWVFEERPASKTEAAHRYAGFLIQRERAPEALGVLRTTRERLNQQEERPPEQVQQELADTRLIEGIANIMLGRFQDAADILRENEAKPQRDMWLGVALTGLEQHQDALPLLEENIEQATAYPAMLNQAARYYFARALYNAQRYTDSMNQLDRLALLGGENRFLPMAQLLMGRNYEAQGQLDNAEQVYINLASHPNKKVANHALLYFMNLLNQRGDLTPEAAIVRYENLRFNWRGDMVEEESLYQLGQLYIETREYRKALERLRSLTANYPESQYAEQAAAQMTKVYEDVLMDRNGVDAVSKVEKLALYYDFRELTPSGEEGDRLVTHVAEELANLGLYQRATDILERQLQFRVRDRDAVGRLGYELAKIHGQNYQPEEGLKVLRRTESSRLPESLQNNRARVKAELQALDQRPRAALETALDVNTSEGRTLQAALAWELGRNNVIIDALAGRFNGAGGADWEDEQATQFLQLVTALSQTGQRERLNELRLNYQPGISAHGLESQVLFLVQAADESSPLPEGVTLPEAPTTFWPEATQALAKQNSFNNTYEELRERWEREREQAIRTEIEARNQELRRRR